MWLVEDITISLSETDPSASANPLINPLILSFELRIIFSGITFLLLELNISLRLVFKNLKTPALFISKTNAFFVLSE